MSSQYGYTLISRTGSDRFLRGWRAAAQELVSAAIVVADFAIIIATAVTTGIGYHEAVYSDIGDVVAFLQVGAITATIMIGANLFRGEYQLANFLVFKPHVRRSIQLWNVTFICLLVLAFLAKVTVVFSRGWVILFYLLGIPVILVLRFVFVAVVTHGTRSGLISTKRVFLLGTAAAIEEFVSRYDPASLGVRIVGCRFFTPAASGLRPEARRTALSRDLKAALFAARDVQPDAIFIITPWSESDTIDVSVDVMLSLPAEIHLGPEDVLNRFHNVQLAKLGPMSSLQLTRLPLSRFEVLQKRAFDLVLLGDPAGPVHAAPSPGRGPHQARQPRPGLLSAAALRLQPEAVSHHKIQDDAHARRRAGGPSGDPRRPQGHPPRPVAQALEHRRDSAAPQRLER